MHQLPFCIVIVYISTLIKGQRVNKLCEQTVLGLMQHFAWH